MKNAYQYVSLVVGLLLLTTAAFAQSAGFRVQVAAYNQPVSLDYFKGISSITENVAYQGIYRYFVEGFKTEAEAAKVRDQAIALGFKNAHVVPAKAPGEIINCCVVYETGEKMKFPEQARDLPTRTREMPEAYPRTAPKDPNLLKEISPSIRNIFFDFDKSNIRDEAAIELDKCVNLLKKNPTYKVNIHAHTDAKGSDEYNQALSIRRRDAAIAYLKSHGISADRIDKAYYGESAPIALNELGDGSDNPVGRQLNRRVELSITEKGKLLDLVEDIWVPSDMLRGTEKPAEKKK